jgi:TfoX/Sxy family transcriptional regulator of competence genes
VKIPKPSDGSVEFFRSVVPDDYRVSMKPMFGNLAAFANGNLFMGLYGDDIFVRLAEEDQPELLEISGASAFAPMGGHVMKAYVVLPKSFLKDPDRIAEWVNRSLEWSLTLSSKKKSSKNRKKK